AAGTGRLAASARDPLLRPASPRGLRAARPPCGAELPHRPARPALCLPAAPAPGAAHHRSAAPAGRPRLGRPHRRSPVGAARHGARHARRRCPVLLARSRRRGRRRGGAGPAQRPRRRRGRPAVRVPGRLGPGRCKARPDRPCRDPGGLTPDRRCADAAGPVSMPPTGRMELVCPAGTPAALRTAVEAGADSVYCGFNDETNARNFPGLNFSREELRTAIDYAHGRGARVLVAVNTFPRAGAGALWRRAVDDAAGLGADALILADLGLLAYAAEH